MIDYGSAVSTLDDSQVAHCHLIEVETPVSTLRYNTSALTLTWDSKTWVSGSNVLDIQFPDETAELEAKSCKVVVNALNPATTSLALRYNLHGRPFAVYHAMLNKTGYAIIDVAKIFSGRVSHTSMRNAEARNVV